MTDEITLPPLPLPDHAGPHGTGTYFSAWSEKQVREAQCAAVLLDRQQRDKPAPSAETVAWLDESTSCAYSRAELDPGSEVGLVPLYTTPPDHREAMQQALDALEERYIGALRDNALDALRAALEPKQC
jgi:hypothetical protein